MSARLGGNCLCSESTGPSINVHSHRDVIRDLSLWGQQTSGDTKLYVRSKVGAGQPDYVVWNHVKCGSRSVWIT